ncbi:MAG TPA: hypothetical protein VND70_00585 [Acidimicrobiales bacterium]|nr:hypothetical protein [Acidimicrobiales bacterium]
MVEEEGTLSRHSQTTVWKDSAQFRCHCHTQSGTRVRTCVHRPKTVDADSRIELGGFQLCMSEHLGDVADIRTSFQHEGGDAVSKKVATSAFLDSSKSDVMPHRG